MKRIRLVGLSLVAIFAASAATAASASALPEWSGPFPKPLTSSSGVSKLETKAGMLVECVADTNEGEVTGPNSAVVRIRFTGCELVLATGKIPCTTPGAPPEEIVTFPLVGTLGYITHTPTKTMVGLDLASPAAGLIARFVCGETIAEVVGSVIGKITPINKLVKPAPAGHFTLKFKAKKGKQKPTKFESEPEDTLSASFGGGPLEPAGLTSTDIVGFFEPVKIAA